MLLGLFEMGFEALFQLPRVGGFGHLGQRLDELGLRAVEIAQFLQEKFVERGDFAFAEVKDIHGRSSFSRLSRIGHAKAGRKGFHHGQASCREAQGADRFCNLQVPGDREMHYSD